MAQASGNEVDVFLGLAFGVPVAWDWAVIALAAVAAITMSMEGRRGQAVNRVHGEAGCVMEGIIVPMADAMPDAGSVRDAVAFLWHFFRLVLPPVLIPLCAFFVPMFVIGYVKDLIQRRRVAEIERRLKSRICVHCGYDLRESVGRCPECGEKIAAK